VRALLSSAPCGQAWHEILGGGTVKCAFSVVNQNVHIAPAVLSEIRSERQESSERAL
jgi:hypothetical protein